jgi:hypothetical protein
MQSEQRLTILKIAAGAVVGLFLLDRMILSPAVAGMESADRATRGIAPESTARTSAHRAGKVAA